MRKCKQCKRELKDSEATYDGICLTCDRGTIIGEVNVPWSPTQDDSPTTGTIYVDDSSPSESSDYGGGGSFDGAGSTDSWSDSGSSDSGSSY